MTDTEDAQPGSTPGGSANAADGVSRGAAEAGTNAARSDQPGPHTPNPSNPGPSSSGPSTSGASNSGPSNSGASSSAPSSSGASSSGPSNSKFSGSRASYPGSTGAVPDTQRLLANRYRLDSLLGRGSMGAVWKALDVVLGRSVAVKEVLLPPTQTNEENDIARERALREARSIAALSHPNVVTLYDVVEDDGRPWVVMELVPAKNLAEIIKDDGILKPTEAARIGLAVLAALNSAHEVGITHRDVKPGNILVSPDGRVKLADFGISRRAEDSALTRTGLMVGSPSYIAPEVARGRAATSAVDIWGLGATLQCAVEGTPPFDLGDPVATLTAVVGDPPQPAPHAGPLQPLITRMLEKDPRDRIRPDEARRLLEDIIAARPVPRPTYAPPTGPLAPSSGSTPGPMRAAMRGPGPAGSRTPPPHPVSGPMAPMSPGPMMAPGSMNSGAPSSGPMNPDPPNSGPMSSRTIGPAGTPSRPTAGPSQHSPSLQGSSQHSPSQQGSRPGGPMPRSGGVSQHTSNLPTGQGVYGAHAAPRAAYAPGTGQQPLPQGSARGTSTSPTKRRGAHNPWIAALIGLLLAAVIGTAIILWVTNDKTSSNGADPSSSSVITPSLHPTSNDTKLDGTTASGAIAVSGIFRPFSFELPEGWEAVKIAADLQSNRSEFIQSDGGSDPSSMVKVTVVAEPLNGTSADAHLQGQMVQIGSPAMLPGYSEVSYDVTAQDNVLWQYTNVLNGAQRHGFLYATVRGEDILWKVLTSGPYESGDDTANIANDVIKTFNA